MGGREGGGGNSEVTVPASQLVSEQARERGLERGGERASEPASKRARIGERRRAGWKAVERDGGGLETRRDVEV